MKKTTLLNIIFIIFLLTYSIGVTIGIIIYCATNNIYDINKDNKVDIKDLILVQTEILKKR